jgi:hypothetical protein
MIANADEQREWEADDVPSTFFRSGTVAGSPPPGATSAVESAAVDPRKHTRQTRLLAAASLLIVAVVGVSGLTRPFGGDQGLFVFMAERMNHGAVLYRDIWDAKQPGIYFFYLGAGRLFGFNEIGIHTAELLVMLAFALVLQRTLPDLIPDRRLAAVSPLFVVLPFFVVGSSWDLTLLEPMLSFPLYVAMWASIRSRSADDERPWQLIAGLCAGLVAMFKIIYFPIPMVFLLLSLRRRRLAANLITWAAGVAAVWTPLIAWIMAHDLSSYVFSTWVDYPKSARELGAQPVSLLVSTTKSFGRSMAGVGVLAIAALVAWRTRLDRFHAMLVAWLGLGTAMILSQFWWRYLFWLLLVPIGLLALEGFAWLADYRRTQPRRVAAVGALVVILLIYGFVPEAGRFKRVVEHPVGVFRDGPTQVEYQALQQSDYGHLQAWLAPISGTDALPGPIIVFGNPVVQWASGRLQSGSIPGFNTVMLSDYYWQIFIREMRADPPTYVYFGFVRNGDMRQLVRDRAPQVDALLNSQYCPLTSVEGATWLVRCDHSPGTPLKP